ncbi:hypothetical protein BDBG_16577 [Blastomyces gilchristii SLH14081]|uniref:Uncharacterized protein n=1 Tax=Blastomyces gilchristii (strain SLH14081) TaxID=559298 RepID=A0A179UGQ7_BLAGS|nr:uncharacterized protein BDBG_16577 [Blastomyces gilchristii SLH14081]OAT06201.1 hypothetical protein BDBG_16577 [Blastomyces gilchristii SLH14081]
MLSSSSQLALRMIYQRTLFIQQCTGQRSQTLLPQVCELVEKKWHAHSRKREVKASLKFLFPAFIESPTKTAPQDQCSPRSHMLGQFLKNCDNFSTEMGIISPVRE